MSTGSCQVSDAERTELEASGWLYCYTFQGWPSINPLGVAYWETNRERDFWVPLEGEPDA